MPNHARTLGQDALFVGVSLATVVALGVLASDRPFIVLVLPILVAAYVGGRRAGILSTMTCALGGAAFVALDGDPPRELIALATLVVIGGTISVTFEMMHAARRRSERSERLYSESFLSSPVPISLNEFSTGRVIDTNEAYTRLTGWSRSEMRGIEVNVRNIATQEERDRVHDRLAAERVLRDVPVTIKHKNGDTRDALLSAVLVELDGVPHAVTTVVDVTDQRRAESAVHESEARFRDLAETIDEVFWLTSPYRDETHYISPAFERVWGLPCEKLYASPLAWLEAVHPEDRARAMADAMTLAATQIDFRIVRPDGKVRWIHNRSFPVRDEAGAIVRMAGVAVDITDHKKLEEELQQAQKMESLGRLAGGVAHDFNNVLAVISTNGSILGELLDEDGEPREILGEIEHAVQRASGLTLQLLAFSRKQRIEPVVLELNTVVRDTQKMLRRMIGEDIVLETSLEPDLAHVRIDAGQLVQVLMNLAVNARDAMSDGGKLALTTRNVPGPWPKVELAVTDTGCGMSPEIAARMFEPFFTTKGVGKGTGMGLAVVHGIVQQAGGYIDVETSEDAGTTFRIFLPAVDAPLGEQTAAKPVQMRGVESVLVVDDDPHVRSATTRALRSKGYRTVDAADGATALRMLTSGRFDLLVTDVVMPGMNGRELAEAARVSLPALKVLYTSGYTDDEVVARGVMRGEVALLEKPFRADALASKVREVLDRAVGGA